MDTIEISITEKKKKIKALTLFNFKDELVNFMYKKTIADSSRTSMRFFLLIFFISLKVNGKSLLMDLLDSTIPKLKSLNLAFSKKPKLLAGEYATLVQEHNLTEIFKYDILFILLECISGSEEIFKKFQDYFDENSSAKNDFLKVIEKHKENVDDIDIDFRSHLIQDDRWDEFGEYHDLSKSVYRTIKMRTSRHIDLALHKYAEVKVISSQSPIDVNICQYVEPNLIIHLWETYKVGEYAKDVWNIVNQPIPAGITLIFMERLASRFLKWKSISGKKDRRGKLKAKAEFEQTKNEDAERTALLKLTQVLTKSILKSHDFLLKEIGKLKENRENVSKNSAMTEKKRSALLKDLDEEISELENLEVTTEKK